ncbi:MAG: putative porin, partial [bacterium]
MMKVHPVSRTGVMLKFVFAVAIVAGLLPTKLSAQGINFSGDLRLRLEKDYNVTGKDDRDRARYRFRINAIHKRGDHIQIGARIRSGNPIDQQSPHQNFGGDFSSKNFFIDKVYLKYAWGNGWVWAGKNSFPFWKQNEMFWDDDVNPEGVSISVSTKGSSSSKVTFTGGYYILDDFTSLLKTTMNAAQVHYSGNFESVGLNLAGGFYLFNFDDELQANDGYDPL